MPEDFDDELEFAQRDMDFEAQDFGMGRDRFRPGGSFQQGYRVGFRNGFQQGYRQGCRDCGFRRRNR